MALCEETMILQIWIEPIHLERNMRSDVYEWLLNTVVYTAGASVSIPDRITYLDCLL